MFRQILDKNPRKDVCEICSKETSGYFIDLEGVKWKICSPECCLKLQERERVKEMTIEAQLLDAQSRTRHWSVGGNPFFRGEWEVLTRSLFVPPGLVEILITCHLCGEKETRKMRSDAQFPWNKNRVSICFDCKKMRRKARYEAKKQGVDN